MKNFEIDLNYPLWDLEIVPYKKAPIKKVKPLYTEKHLFEYLQAKEQELQNNFKQQLMKEKKLAYESGFKAAELKYSKEYKKKFNEPLDNFHSIIKSLRNEIEYVSDEHEQDILKLVINIAKKIIGYETSINSEILLSTLKRALSLLNEKQNVKILINPEDWTLVKNSISELSLNIDLPNDVEIVASAKITKGGCRIETVSGSIDAEIETQFEEIAKKLLKS